MSTLGDLLAEHTVLPGNAVDHLHAVVGEWQLLADLSFADLVLWDPAFFGVRPHVVVKGGMIAWAQMGDANASIPTPQPVYARPMFGAQPLVAAASSESRCRSDCFASDVTTYFRAPCSISTRTASTDVTTAIVSLPLRFMASSS